MSRLASDLLHTFIPVSHRARQFEEWLADALEDFRMRQEGLVSRVPRLVRDMTLREFARYNGDVQAALKALQRERLGGEAEAIDKTTRKRKWVESQEAEAKAADASEAEPSRAAKSGVSGCSTAARSLKDVFLARMMAATPKKKLGFPNAPGTTQRPRVPSFKTPSNVRSTTFACPTRAEIITDMDNTAHTTNRAVPKPSQAAY